MPDAKKNTTVWKVIGGIVGSITIVTFVFMLGRATMANEKSHLILNTKTDNNCESIKVVDEKVNAEIFRSTNVDEKTAKSISEIDKNIAVQAQIMEQQHETLKKMEKKMP